METNQIDQQAARQIYDYAANLLVNQNKSVTEVEQILVEKGFEKEAASLIVQTLSTQITAAKRERANKDMLYGALWCVGGTVATIANIGFIFWGAIIFGGIQFFKGLSNRF